MSYSSKVKENSVLKPNQARILHLVSKRILVFRFSTKHLCASVQCISFDQYAKHFIGAVFNKLRTKNASLETAYIAQYTDRACNLMYRGSRLCVLGVWLVAYNHFHLHHIDSGFFLACGTKQREFHQHSVLIYPRSCLSAANWAVNPSYFVHLFVHPCSFTSGMALHRSVWLFAAVFY